MSGPAAVARSYRWCDRLARRAARNFYPAFLVLPRPQRLAMSALYAFMRVTDDIADEPGDPADARRALADWRAATRAALAGGDSHPLHPAFRDAATRYGIPSQYFEAVIDGVESDTHAVSFEAFADLYGYCYKVASAVGLCCIHVWGFRDAPRALAHAEAAGVAFQLTNILRDLGEDLGRGRVYLPADELRAFDCPPGAWRDPSAAGRLGQLMSFQAERAAGYYREGSRLTPLLSPAGRAVFGVMHKTYAGLLERVRRCGPAALERRVSVPKWRKVSYVLAAWPVRWGWW